MGGQSGGPRTHSGAIYNGKTPILRPHGSIRANDLEQVGGLGRGGLGAPRVIATQNASLIDESSCCKVGGFSDMDHQFIRTVIYERPLGNPTISVIYPENLITKLHPNKSIKTPN